MDDRDIKCSAAKVIDEELPVLALRIGNRRHRRRDRLLEQGDPWQTSRCRRTHRGLRLHLIEGGRNGDDGSVNLEISRRHAGLRDKRFEHLRTCLLW